MLKKDITYEDLDGNKITETFWFNLNKAEMAKMALSKEGDKGGFENWIKTLIASNDGEVLTSTFEQLLLATIGERSADNKRFIKSDEIRQNFQHSDAYSELFMELLTDADKMAAFINGIMPASMREEAEKAAKDATNPQVASVPAPGSEPATDEPEDDRPLWEKENREPTEFELRSMTPEQMRAAFAKRLGAKQAQ